MFDFIKRIFGADDQAEKIMQGMTDRSVKWIRIGESIADDCMKNGLENGMPVYLSQITDQIHKEYSYNTNVIQNGFLTRISSYIDSGSVVTLSIEGGDQAFVHKDHLNDFMKDVRR